MKKYQVIYADPPWLFNTYSDKGKDRSPEQHYTCMNIEDIKNLNIQNLADDDCVLFIWATYPMLQQCLDTIKAWGFTYKTVAFTWVKLLKKWKERSLDYGVLHSQEQVEKLMAMGLGYITRANPEICIYATKGKPKRPNSKSIRNLVISAIDVHSKKPIEVIDRLNIMYPESNKVELFARKKVYPDWDYWGDEIISDIAI